MEGKPRDDADAGVTQTRMNLVALSEVARLACGIAYERAPGRGDAPKIAALLARETQIYTPIEDGPGLRPLTHAELREGRFSEDAGSLTFDDGRRTVQPLVLRRTAVGAAVDAIKRAIAR